MPNAVPEPSATLGALAAVSIGLLFKLKKKQV
ncbi:PEP-CTERM sorting domain-containing protein [Nostoc piscinale]